MKPRPFDEYHEDMGNVLWWQWIEIREIRGGEYCVDGHWAGEPPYVGTPNDLGFTVQVNLDVCLRTHADPAGEDKEFVVSRKVGGWPGYHTHFTIIEAPEPPHS